MELKELFYNQRDSRLRTRNSNSFLILSLLLVACAPKIQKLDNHLSTQVAESQKQPLYVPEFRSGTFQAESGTNLMDAEFVVDGQEFSFDMPQWVTDEGVVLKVYDPNNPNGDHPELGSVYPQITFHKQQQEADTLLHIYHDASDRKVGEELVAIRPVTESKMLAFMPVVVSAEGGVEKVNSLIPEDNPKVDVVVYEKEGGKLDIGYNTMALFTVQFNSVGAELLFWGFVDNTLDGDTPVLVK